MFFSVQFRKKHPLIDGVCQGIPRFGGSRVVEWKCSHSKVLPTWPLKIQFYMLSWGTQITKWFPCLCTHSRNILEWLVALLRTGNVKEWRDCVRYIHVIDGLWYHFRGRCFLCIAWHIVHIISQCNQLQPSNPLRVTYSSYTKLM